jgi:hypothetical protein
VSDFHHLLKNYLNKVENHPVVICPESSEDLVTCEDFQALFDLSNPLSDKSSIGRMRDAYALKLFSLANCADCMEKGG